MKIAASLGVKDEVELIGPAIAHLRAIGVSHIIVSDSGSTDGTLELLHSLEGPGLDIRHFDDRSTDPGLEETYTRDLIARARATGADWLAFLDADEVFLVEGGDLTRVRGLHTADVIELRRFNVPLLPDGPAIGMDPLTGLDHTLLYAPDTPRLATVARVRQDADAPWIGVIPAPKVMINLATVDTTGEGHHTAKAAVGDTRHLVPDDLVVAHLPFTTEARFAQKLRNIKVLVDEVGHLWGKDSAWHWRRWLQNVDDKGGVAGEIARNRVTAEELAELRRVGVVKTAREALARSVSLG